MAAISIAAGSLPRECECARKGLGFSVSAEVAAMCQEPAGIGGPETARLRVQFS